MWPWSKRRPPPEPPFSEISGASYAALIEVELTDEERRRESIERRGLAIVTSTGVITGIALAAAPLAAALAGEGRALVVPLEAKGFLLFAGLCLAIAVVSGIVANMPQRYEVAEDDGLARLLEPQFWNARRRIGSRRAAEVRQQELKSARAANSVKTLWLRFAFAFHVVGIVSVGAAALIVLFFNLPR